MNGDLEDRLRDAFAAGAGLVTAERLRPAEQAVRRRAPGFRRGAFRVLPVLAAASMAAVIGSVAIVPSLLGNAAGPQPAGVRSPASAQEEEFSAVVDRLARRAEQPGRHWRSEIEAVTWGQVLTQTYNVEDRVRTVYWATDPLLMVTTPLSSRPATAADEKKWRKSGSPDLCGNHIGCETALLRRGLTGYVRLEKLALSPPLTPAQLRALPQDPDELRKQLLQLWSAERRAAARSGGPTFEALPAADMLWAAGEGILTRTPATPEVRAAVLRMLAALPGTRIVDNARDADGRRGLALVRRSERDPLERQIVLDRTSGAVLGIQSLAVRSGTYAGMGAGDMVRADLVRKLGWTDSGPVVPEDCPKKAGEVCVRPRSAK
ncbi:hypothetical protein [Nonomuraea roseola]|uniref:CU044_5270 family protein n=1 Tax=Nonomuraea roseola TaxID=46179 RepID=A0ABV5QF48_9ACTN